MFDNLTEKFERAFKVLKGHGQITEINVAESLKEVRRALLDADVNFKTTGKEILKKGWRVVFEDKEAEEVINYRRDAARAKKMLDKLKEEEGMATPMPEPTMEPEMELEEPEMVEEEPAKTGLMARV